MSDYPPKYEDSILFASLVSAEDVRSGEAVVGGPRERLRPDIEHPYETFLEKLGTGLWEGTDAFASIFTGIGISPSGISWQNDGLAEMKEWVYFGKAPDHWQPKSYEEPWEYKPPSAEQILQNRAGREAELDNASKNLGPFQADFSANADRALSLTPGLESARELGMGNQFAAAGEYVESYKIDNYRADPTTESTSDATNEATLKPLSVA